MTGPDKQKKIDEALARVDHGISIRQMREIGASAMAPFNIELYRNSFNSAGYQSEEQILKLWEWKYEKNPASEKNDNFGLVADFRGELIGQFHIIPVKIKIGGGEYLCAWGSNLAVKEAYRNMGIGLVLSKRLCDETQTKFACLLVGGMNPNSYAIMKTSGFTDIGKIPRYVKLLDLRKIAARFNPGPALSAASGGLSSSRKITLHETVSFGSEFDDFWNTVSSQYECIARRDAEFCNWRYRDQPLWNYSLLSVRREGRIAGFAVLRDGEIKNGRLKGLKTGIVSDILLDARDHRSRAALLSAITDLFRKKGAALIKLDILSSRIEPFLLLSGFIRIPSASRFVLRINDMKIAPQDRLMMLGRKGWHITSGDSDFDFD